MAFIYKIYIGELQQLNLINRKFVRLLVLIKLVLLITSFILLVKKL